uniref:Uncharacterized protein n=1 Tax=Panagrolaimus sp. PS1159 TaxID=55785 RepID=A0AC35G4Q0_9BILA
MALPNMTANLMSKTRRRKRTLSIDFHLFNIKTFFDLLDAPISGRIHLDRAEPPAPRPIVSGTVHRPGLGVCTENEFRCDVGKCIALKLRCDSFDDCGDNSDERDCRKFYLLKMS